MVVRRAIQKLKIGFKLRANRRISKMRNVDKRPLTASERKARARAHKWANGPGENSPYKLSGLGKDAAWEAEIQRAINQKRGQKVNLIPHEYRNLSGRDVSEIKALEQWYRLPPERRREMENWLMKHGKRK